MTSCILLRDFPRNRLFQKSSIVTFQTPRFPEPAMKKYVAPYDNKVLSKEEPILFVNGQNEAERDPLLWNAFRAGSREALDYIFKQHAPNLFKYGSKFSKDQDFVLDCIQDLFVELWNRRQSLSDTDCIKYYLLKALRRRIVRSLQGNQRFEEVQKDFGYLEEKVNFSAEHILITQEMEVSKRASVKRAFESLTKRQRESIYLKFTQGLDNQEIASIMDLNLSSVNTLISQSIRALRTALGKNS